MSAGASATSAAVDVAIESATIPADARPTREQLARLKELFSELGERDPDTDWKAHAREIAGVPADVATKTVASVVISRLEEELAA